MTSLDRGLDILSFVACHGPTTAEAISRSAGLPLSTTYRYLTTLRAEGYIDDYEGDFDLGLKTLRMLRPQALQRCLAAIAGPVIFDLVASTGQTVLLTVRDGWSATCIKIAEPQRTMRLAFRRGVSLSLHEGAAAKPLLAHMDDSFIRRYLDARVAWEGQDPQAAWEDLAETRNRGFAVTVGELESEVGVGAPVFWDGEIAACISTIGPSARMPAPWLRDLVNRVTRAGERLTAVLTETDVAAYRRITAEAREEAS